MEMIIGCGERLRAHVENLRTAAEALMLRSTPLIAYLPVLAKIDSWRREKGVPLDVVAVADSLFVDCALRMFEAIESFPKDRADSLKKGQDLSRFVGVYNYIHFFESSLLAAPKGTRRAEVSMLVDVYQAWFFTEPEQCRGHLEKIRREGGSLFATCALAEAVDCAVIPVGSKPLRRLKLFVF